MSLGVKGLRGVGRVSVLVFSKKDSCPAGSPLKNLLQTRLSFSRSMVSNTLDWTESSKLVMMDIRFHSFRYLLHDTDNDCGVILSIDSLAFDERVTVTGGLFAIAYISHPQSFFIGLPELQIEARKVNLALVFSSDKDGISIRSG